MRLTRGLFSGSLVVWTRPAGAPVRERSRVLVLLHRGTAKATDAIAAIIARYKARFHQQSVLRVDTPVRAQF